MSLALSAAIGLNVFFVAGSLAFGGQIAGLVARQSDIAFMAVTREIWTADIVNNLFKNNDFARRAFNADQWVLAGKVVHIPVAGAPSTINKNVTSFPVSAVKRTDSDINYSIDTFYSTPRHIEQIEKYEDAYDKRQSALGEDQSALIDAAMDNLVYTWLPLVANTVLCDGAPVAATLTGATGTRTSLTKQSFSEIKLSMDAVNIPDNGRLCVLTAYHYNQFFNSLSDAEKPISTHSLILKPARWACISDSRSICAAPLAVTAALMRLM
jgi:hypothetical protein